MYGAHPEHFWLIHMIEAFVLFPLRWKSSSSMKPSEVFTFCDYCWVVNFAGAITMLLCIVDDNEHLGGFNMLTAEIRRTLFVGYFAVSCGPLMLAVLGLGNAMVFHDIANLSSLFIHIFPPLTMSVMRFQSHHVEEGENTIRDVVYVFTLILPFTK